MYLPGRLHEYVDICLRLRVRIDTCSVLVHNIPFHACTLMPLTRFWCSGVVTQRAGVHVPHVHARSRRGPAFIHRLMAELRDFLLAVFFAGFARSSVSHAQLLPHLVEMDKR